MTTLRPDSRGRGALSLLLCLLILGSSVAAPLLERGGLRTGPTVESAHDPDTCAHPHDHRICTQVGANIPLGSAVQAYHVAHLLVEVAPTSDVRTASDWLLLEGPPARAPPRA